MASGCGSPHRSSKWPTACLYGEAPKADSVRTISLSLESGENLARWREKQQKKREEWANAWVESDCVWTQENREPLHPDWVSRRFKRLIELSGLPPVRLHDLRHLSATLSLLAKNDIKVVQERLGHSSRQITSDTYTSVLPEMMRAEAESTMTVVPRGVSYEVRSPLVIPDGAWQGDVATIFAHGTLQPGSTWAIGAQTRPGTDLLGEIRTKGHGQEHAANAALEWIREHCTSNGLELVWVENLNDRYAEDQKRYFSLLRFDRPFRGPGLRRVGAAPGAAVRLARERASGTWITPEDRLTAARSPERIPVSPVCPLDLALRE
ncbi:tyrosine-type recombinase/integrase [Streptomyces sp. SCPE 10]|uniref:tyrosine-type recombinase/integrase n=1 Tax=Streptomyces TaxID=1883 RepID=UPI0033AB53E3